MSAEALPKISGYPQKSVFLIKDSKWVPLNPKQLERQSLHNFEATAKRIVEIWDRLSCSCPSEEALRFLEGFNSAWTLAHLRNGKIQGVKKEQVIRFSSFTKHRWLSNFFPTLIWDKKHGRLLPHVEAGYVAFKMTREGEDLEVIAEAASTFDPKQVKQLGKHIRRKTSLDNKAAIIEMQRLVRLKFEQNPVLQTFLLSSKCSFEEKTSDPFWGTAHGTMKGPDSNHLGRIIEIVRDTLS